VIWLWKILNTIYSMVFGGSENSAYGVGNPLRSDDGIGSKNNSHASRKVVATVSLIDSETIPEDHIESILKLKPTHILIIDAALMNVEPGSAKLYETWLKLKEQFQLILFQFNFSVAIYF